MQNLLIGASSPFYINLPYHLAGWLGWGCMLALLAFFVWRKWETPHLSRWPRWLILLILALAAPLSGLLLRLPLPGESALPLPMMPVERSVPEIIFLSAVPWVLAAGMLGVVPSVLLGALSGLVISLVDTHSLFTPILVAGMAFLFSQAVRQRYRTPFYQLLRRPVGAAVAVILIFVPVFMISGLFEVKGSLAVRIDFAITETWPVIIARGAEMLVAALLAELLLAIKIPYWQRPALLVPSPSETSLESRFLLVTLPLLILLVFTLVIADWMVAGSVAREMVRRRLESTAKVAADSLPYFMEAGQNLIRNLATPDLPTLPPEKLRAELALKLRSVPYFRQLYVMDADGKPVGGYPNDLIPQNSLTPEEDQGVGLALKGVLIQNYVIPPVKNESTAQISFLVTIQDEQDRAIGVLIGRTDLNSNPFTQPAIQALDTVREMGGVGVILDENQKMLYNPDPALVMNDYFGRVPASDQTAFFDEYSQTGTRRLVYAQPIAGRIWTVMLTVPAEQAQQMALQIAVPLLLILAVISILVIFFLRINLRTVTGSLQLLGQETTRISQGELSHPLNVTGEDEVGRLGSSFEKMRLSLKARLEELNRLLLVSQGVGSTLEIRDAVQPILEAALCDGASLARIVLLRDVTLDGQPGEHPFASGLGLASEQYAYLDDALFDLMRSQELLLVPNTNRVRRVTLPPGRPHPSAIMARALYHENSYYGALWIAYDQPRAFNDEEVRFFSTLAGEAALAAANARLYANAEVGRQRLEAVLSSTPEPVLVTDEKSRLLLLNPAALQVPGLVASSTPGRPIKEIIPMPALLDLLAGPDDRQNAREITLPNNRVYYVSVSPVVAEGQMVGKVCILRDITHYKELDNLKSDFVATVSHDLRSPLTLMRGYATMLQMVGDLNEQQKSYLRKINLGVENMTRLVNNLLDLGRIEAGIDLQLEKVTIGEVVDQVLNALQPQAIQKTIALTQEQLLQQPVSVEADAALLQQAFYNLVENAIKYTPVGGQVKVRLQARPSGVVFEVQDTGIGVAPLDLPRLFEKFFRSGRREAYQQRGTGLGLAIVKSIAERHGGRVWVESTLGKGSIFSIEIPYQQHHVAQPAD